MRVVLQVPLLNRSCRVQGGLGFSAAVETTHPRDNSAQLSKKPKRRQAKGGKTGLHGRIVRMLVQAPKPETLNPKTCNPKLTCQIAHGNESTALREKGEGESKGAKAGSTGKRQERERQREEGSQRKQNRESERREREREIQPFYPPFSCSKFCGVISKKLLLEGQVARALHFRGLQAP